MILILRETLALGFVGAVVGLALAWLGIRLYTDEMGAQLGSYWIDIELDVLVFVFAVGVTVIASLLAGITPALRIAAVSEDHLKQHGQTAASPHFGKLNRLLVIFQITLSFALLAGMGLMIENLVRLEADRFDFRKEKILTGRISLYGTSYPDAESKRRGFQAIENRIKSLPGITGVALSYPGLPGESGLDRRIAIEGITYTSRESEPRVRLALVTPGFFSVLERKPLAGRAFRASDGPNAEPVAIVNRSLRERHFPDVEPVGRQVQVGGVWRTIVGVVDDLAMEGLKGTGAAGVYVPLSQVTPSRVSLLAATRDEPQFAGPQIREALSELIPDQPLSDVKTMDDALAWITRDYRMSRAIFVVLGIAALILAVTALYTVLGYSVDLRVEEFAIRMALGADGKRVLWSVLWDGILQIAAGLMIGLLMFGYFSGLLSSLLYRMRPWDPPTLVASAILLSAAGLLATIVPAWRAVRTDPMISLRRE